MQTLRVLIIDDEPGMRIGVERTLRDLVVRAPEVDAEVGFEMKLAETGEEGLAAFKAYAPQIVILDYRLPDMTGVEVLDRLNVSSPSHDFVVIMITAYASIETAVTTTRHGAFDFIAKPFTPEEVKAAVRKSASRVLLQMQARLMAEEKRQVRFQFISVLAHELKAPLNAIEGYLQIIRRRSAGNDMASYDHMLDRCMARAEGMRKLIFDLLDMTRIESGLKSRDFSHLDLREVVAHVMDTVKPDADDRGIAVQFEDGSSPIEMYAARDEMEIVLGNLVSNAVKYNRDGGRVTIRAAREGDRVAMSVEDTGIGMTPEEARKLFQDFVRIKNEKTRRISGSGLGLSTTRKIARLYGGDVTVESVPEVGSTFTVVLHDAKPKGSQ